MLRLCSNKEKICSTAKIIYSVTLCKEEEHSECNSRVSAILSALEMIHLTPKFRGSEIVQVQNYETAIFEDIGEEHSRAYISPLKKAKYSVSEEGVDGSGDTHTTDTKLQTFKESFVSAPGISLVDYVVESAKITKNPPIGFALICSPGHHAVPDGPLDFCSAGNVATAARYAQLVHGLQRVFIIDFSAHPGKGTNDMFSDDPDVFFLSTHQDGILPGAGKIDDIGCGNGVGATLNLPLPAYSGFYAMVNVFHEVIVPCTQRFKPDIILVSAGYDGHVQDRASKLQYNTTTYKVLAYGIKKLAKDLCGGRCVFFLEGGYNLESLSNSVAESFSAFMEEPLNIAKHDSRNSGTTEPFLAVREVIKKIKQLHSLENPKSV